MPLKCVYLRKKWLSPRAEVQNPNRTATFHQGIAGQNLRILPMRDLPAGG
jgi:hypothetical protein